MRYYNQNYPQKEYYCPEKGKGTTRSQKETQNKKEKGPREKKIKRKGVQEKTV